VKESIDVDFFSVWGKRKIVQVWNTQDIYNAHYYDNYDFIALIFQNEAVLFNEIIEKYIYNKAN